MCAGLEMDGRAPALCLYISMLAASFQRGHAYGSEGGEVLLLRGMAEGVALSAADEEGGARTYLNVKLEGEYSWTLILGDEAV